PMVAELKRQLAVIGRMPENQKLSDDRPGVSADSDSGWMDSFCKDFSSQCRRSDAVDPKEHSWADLPWPAVDRICCHLFRRYNCSDLANLAQVSTHYLSGVNDFMIRDYNKPGIYAVELPVYRDGVLCVDIRLVSSNLLFYGLSDLDSARFIRRRRNGKEKWLEVRLNGVEDPIFAKVSGLLSTSIKEVVTQRYWTSGFVRISSENFSLIAQDRTFFCDGSPTE
ncbi:hypothetical protein PMAYCL1PPCAC_03957, partial [Pristionchus mayeri]